MSVSTSVSTSVSAGLNTQHGSALIVSLIMLTAVTFLAIVNLQSSTTQVRIVNNLQTKETVFHTSKRELITKYVKYRKNGNSSDDLAASIEQAVNNSVASVLTDVAIDTSQIDSITSSLRFKNNTPVNFNYGFSSDSSIGHLTQMQFEVLTETVDKSERFSSSQLLGFTFQRISAN